MDRLVIHEAGPRDGLQIEKKPVPTGQKIEWIKDLLGSGIDIIQLGSFVNPKKVPQMADTDELFEYFSQPKNNPGNVILSGLVLNEKGLERGMVCGVERFCMGVSASDTHSRKNTAMTTAEAADRIIAMAGSAVAAKKAVQVSVQSAFGCGYEGAVPEEKVLEIVKRFLDAGLRIISLADTAGHANPLHVKRLFGAVLKLDPQVECVCHFHDTYGMGLANCRAAMEAGVRCFESTFAGLGGCPFTAVTGGNVCTEDLVHMLQCMGIRRDIKLSKIIGVAKDAGRFFDRELPGVIHKTGPIEKRNTA